MAYLLLDGTRQLESLKLSPDLFRERKSDLVDLMLATGLKRSVTMGWNQQMCEQIPAVFATDSGGLIPFNTDAPKMLLHAVVPVMGAHMMVRAAEESLGCVPCPFSDMASFAINNPSRDDFERITPARGTLPSRQVLGWLTVNNSKGAGVHLTFMPHAIWQCTRRL